MEVEVHVSEEELAEFREEATESTGTQEQSSQAQNQGNVQSLLSIEAFPTPSLLRKIRKGYTRYVIGETPDVLVGSFSQAR